MNRKRTDWNGVEGEGIEFREGWSSPLWYKTVRFKVLNKIGVKIFQHGPGTAKGLRVSGADRMMVAGGGCWPFRELGVHPEKTRSHRRDFSLHTTTCCQIA